MSKQSRVKSKAKEPVIAAEIKLDLGAGRNPIAGFTSVDLYAPDAQVKCDLFKTPWKGEDGKILWADESVSEIHASHFVEHIPREQRWPFFEECWRVLKVGGIMRIFVPNWKSERAYGDMTHEFPAVTAMAFYYLNKGWREANKLTYGPYDIKCDFDHQAGPSGIGANFVNRAHEAQVFACQSYTESYQDMWATLTKRQM
jgi:hypothetical protein